MEQVIKGIISNIKEDMLDKWIQIDWGKQFIESENIYLKRQYLS